MATKESSGEDNALLNEESTGSSLAFDSDVTDLDDQPPVADDNLTNTRKFNECLKTYYQSEHNHAYDDDFLRYCESNHLNDMSLKNLKTSTVEDCIHMGFAFTLGEINFPFRKDITFNDSAKLQHIHKILLHINDYNTAPREMSDPQLMAFAKRIVSDLEERAAAHRRDTWEGAHLNIRDELSRELSRNILDDPRIQQAISKAVKSHELPLFCTINTSEKGSLSVTVEKLDNVGVDARFECESSDYNESSWHWAVLANRPRSLAHGGHIEPVTTSTTINAILLNVILSVLHSLQIRKYDEFGCPVWETRDIAMRIANRTYTVTFYHQNATTKCYFLAIRWQSDVFYFILFKHLREPTQWMIYDDASRHFQSIANEHDEMMGFELDALYHANIDCKFPKVFSFCRLSRVPRIGLTIQASIYALRCAPAADGTVMEIVDLSTGGSGVGKALVCV